MTNSDDKKEIEKFYYYSKGIDFIDIVDLMNYIAFPANVDDDFAVGGVNESFHNCMLKHIKDIQRE